MPTNFRIVLDVEEALLGTVMKQLNRMPGVARIHMDFNQGKVPLTNGAGAPAKKRYARRNVATATLLDLLSKGARQGSVLAKMVSETGVHGASAVGRAYRAKLISRTRQGYVLTRAGKQARQQLKGLLLPENSHG